LLIGHPICLFTVRLNGTSGNYGILEVMVSGSWSVVCETSFNENAAKVLCRQLNYKDGRFQQGMSANYSNSMISD